MLICAQQDGRLLPSALPSSKPNKGSIMADPRTCSIQDCDNVVLAKDYCGKHYMRLRKHGDPLAGGTPNGEPAAFYENVVLPYEGSECLTWPFSRNAAGYGRIWVDGGM